MDGTAKGQRIGVRDTGPAGQAKGQAREADIRGAQALGDVAGGGIALKVGGEGKQNLADGFRLNALHQGRDAKLADAGLTAGGQLAHQGMITPTEGTGGLDGVDIGGILDHAKEGIVAVGARAEGTGVGVVRGEGTALGTETDALTGLLKRLHQSIEQGLGPSDKGEGRALGTPPTEAGKTREHVNQIVKRLEHGGLAGAGKTGEAAFLDHTLHDLLGLGADIADGNVDHGLEKRLEPFGLAGT